MREKMKINKITIKELLESFSLKLELSENILNYKVLNNDYFYEKIKEKFLIGQYVKDFYNPEWGEEKEFDCYCFESDTSVVWLMPDYELTFVYLRRPSKDKPGFTTITAFSAVLMAIEAVKAGDYQVNSIQEYAQMLFEQDKKAAK